MALDDIINERLRKLEKIRKGGADPYPARTIRNFLIKDAIKKFASLAKSKRKINIVGRIMAIREHGGSTFVNLQDGSGSLQIYLKEDVLGDSYRFFLEVADRGDFISSEGRMFKTKKGETTLEVSSWGMLAKSLRPLPEKWHGLQDVEERFRKRYLDILMNPEVRKRFETRSKIIKILRDFFEKNGFLEVETPMLHTIPGGALAKPFVTHHNALDIDLYLRIAPELFLKRLLISGWEKVFEVGKSFRNEGIDASHNPEFTEPECYAAFWGEEDMMKFVEDMFSTLAKNFGQKETVEFEGQKIIFKKPLARITFQDLLKRYALVTDYDHETRDSLAIRARQLGIDADRNGSKGKIADEIYKKICRPYLVQPTFVTNHPLDISPLAKAYKGDREVRRFQLVAAGMELTNGFAELNDPQEQRRRFAEQEKMRSGGEEEAHRIDKDYIEAMEYGMPPAAGLGIGLDRGVMLFTNTRNIREVILFPTLKPKI